MLKMRSIRGPASYTAGGFTYTLGDVERVSFGSGAIGRRVTAEAVSSSYARTRVVSHSGNMVTIEAFDHRSGDYEAVNGTDLSLVDIAVTYEGF